MSDDFKYFLRSAVLRGLMVDGLGVRGLLVVRVTGGEMLLKRVREVWHLGGWRREHELWWSRRREIWQGMRV